jgi:hypothetical protein
MPENISASRKVQITLTRSLLDQLEALGLTGMYGTKLKDVIEHILSAEIRRLRASGEFKDLRDIKSYPSKEADDDGEKESDA